MVPPAHRETMEVTEYELVQTSRRAAVQHTAEQHGANADVTVLLHLLFTGITFDL